MSQGVCYLLVGDDPWYRLMLTASITTLRDHYDGEVVVLTDQPDLSLGVRQELVIPPLSPRRDIRDRVRWHHTKTQAGRLSRLSSTVFLDCDTLVAKPIDELFLSDGDERLRLTRYGDRTVRDRQIRHRLLNMLGAGLLHPSRLDRLMRDNTVAVNTGVYALTDKMAWSDEWLRTTRSVDRFWIHDEMAAQTLYPDRPHDLVADDRFNVIPMFSKTKDAAIWHCIGGSYGHNYFSNKPIPPYTQLWFDTVARLWADNIGRVREWWDIGVMLPTEAV